MNTNQELVIQVQNQPVYRVIAKDGSSFEYVAIAWGDVEIVG